MGDGQKYYMRAEHVVAASMALSALDIVAVALRFWARKLQRQPPKADDWLMIPATLVTIGIGIDQTYGVSQKGLGYWTEIPTGYTGDILDLVTHQLISKSQVEWAYLLLLPLALGCLKTSFLFFYMRVFAIQKKSAIFRFLTGCITFVVLWALAFFFATLFECGHNFELIWGSQREFKMWCSDTSLLVRILCFIDFITDLVIILIPVPLVLRLKLSTGKKIGVCSLFFLGGGTVVASLLRLIMMEGNFILTSDSILSVTACMYWGMVECGVGVFAACLPTVQFLFKKRAWEPVSTSLFSTKSMFSSRSSRLSENYRNGIHIDQRLGSSYAKIDSNRSRSESPTELPRVEVGAPMRRTHDMWDERINAAV
ncbi:hypothetical protein F4819DRAFT_477547 [Hypoxylon fuscum]|nr:hypothetical protein F4819DRAFT_477547 [Hypoxylon fuscum]